jgi:hypothetical protein
MPSVDVVATKAPSGKGAAAWDNGELIGDERILDEAKRVTHVNLHAEDSCSVAMDWHNPEHVVHALQIGAQMAYGEPILVMSEGVPAHAADPEEE